MTGCGNNKYTQADFGNVFAHIIDGDYNEYITSWFDPNTANTLLQGISSDPTDPNAGLKSIDDIIDFLYSLDAEDESVAEVKDGNNPKYAVENDTADLTSYAAFVEQGGVRQEYEEMVNTFKTQLVERTLLHNGKLIDPTEVSANLYTYRLELLNNLYSFIAPGKELPEFESDEQFTRFVDIVLSQVEYKSRTNDNFKKDYLNSYILLKNFDDLLEDEVDYIKIKPEYKKSGLIGKNMYDSTGPFNYKDRTTGWDEAAGIEDYTSSFIKLLL